MAVKGLVVKAVAQSPYSPKELDLRTLAEARLQLRDQPQQADAVLFGALRDLSRKEFKVSPLMRRYEVTADIQLTIQSAATGEILWSESIPETVTKEESIPVWQFLVEFNTAHPTTIWWIVGAVAALVVLRMAIKAGTRVR